MWPWGNRRHCERKCENVDGGGDSGGGDSGDSDGGDRGYGGNDGGDDGSDADGDDEDIASKEADKSKTCLKHDRNEAAAPVIISPGAKLLVRRLRHISCLLRACSPGDHLTLCPAEQPISERTATQASWQQLHFRTLSLALRASMATKANISLS